MSQCPDSGTITVTWEQPRSKELLSWHQEPAGRISAASSTKSHSARPILPHWQELHLIPLTGRSEPSSHTKNLRTSQLAKEPSWLLINVKGVNWNQRMGLNDKHTDMYQTLLSQRSQNCSPFNHYKNYCRGERRTGLCIYKTRRKNMVSSETKSTFFRGCISGEGGSPFADVCPHTWERWMSQGLSQGLAPGWAKVWSLQAAQGKGDGLVKSWFSTEGPVQAVFSTPLCAIWQVEESGWDFLWMILAWCSISTAPGTPKL